jgi:signal transduction histidine kinase
MSGRKQFRLRMFGGATLQHIRLVDAMSDIVWSIDPRKDDVDDLVVRVRQFAFDLLGQSKIQCRIEAPDSAGLKLESDERRHVFLILKEALNNTVKHSGCTRVIISIRVDGGCFTAEVRDNAVAWSRYARVTDWPT